jgi:hypothetical protein
VGLRPDPSGGLAQLRPRRLLHRCLRDRLTIQELAPWGCVFGIRYGRRRSFYLQENATSTTLEFTKKSELQDPDAQWLKTNSGLPVQKKREVVKGFPGRKYNKTIYYIKRTTTRPMRVSDFYPGGTGRYVSKPLFSKVV